MTDLASSPWVTGFYIVAALFLLLQIWRGWRLGILRSGMSLVALVGSGIIGWYGGLWLGNIFSASQPASRFILWITAGSILALVSYFALLILSALLFKKTRDHSSAPVRLFFGIGGAITGFLVGLVVLAATVSGIRAAGAMSAAFFPPTNALSTLKKNLESGWIGQVVRFSDPIPDRFYNGLGQFSQLSTDPMAGARLMQYPDIANLLQNPKILALATDPSLQKTAQQGNSLALFNNPKFQEVLTDPEIVAAAKKIDFEAALAYALQKKSPATPPSPPPNP